MGIAVSTDSTCDLGKELIEKNNIGTFPIKVILGDKTYCDGVDITPQDIFDYATKTGNLPKTAAASHEEYAEYFEGLLKEHDQVIHISLSSGVSAVNGFAIEAAKRFNGRVGVIDTKALSTGQGLLVLKAAELVAQGMSLEEIVTNLNEIKLTVNTSFVVDTLEYLHKGGRCSLVAMLGAKFLMLHPYIDMVDGKLIPKKKYMGNMSRCVKNYVKDLSEFYPDYDRRVCFITHSNCEKDIVDTVKEKVKELFDFETVIETVAGSVITSHCGKGTIGVLFFKEQVK